jgi:pantothenate kinase
MLLIRVFTHPACTGCGNAVRLAWDFYQQNQDEFEIRTVKLENKEGLAEAHREKIKTIPTIILTINDAELERIVGSPEKNQLDKFLEFLNK